MGRLRDGIDLTMNALRWARLFAVIGSIVLVNGIPDNEYLGEDE